MPTVSPKKFLEQKCSRICFTKMIILFVYGRGASPPPPHQGPDPSPRLGLLLFKIVFLLFKNQLKTLKTA